MATLRDVARVAGVSYQTVSRTLNAPATVRSATREAVEAAIRSVGYYPNAAARRLKLGRSRLLGVVTTDLLGFGPTHTVQAFMEAADSDGWTVLLVRFDPDADWSRVTVGSTSTLNALFEYDVQLVALVGGTPAVAAAISRIAPRLPVIAIGAPLPGYHNVGVDQEGSVADLVYHLSDLGHTRIAHLGGPSTSLDAVERERGWRRAVRSLGLEELPVIRGDWTASGGADAVRAVRVLAFTAIVCANDQTALGAMSALHERGIRVPADVSIVGFDDMDEAASFTPALTTVRQPFEQLARSAFELITVLLREEQLPPIRSLPAQLVIRASTSAVKASQPGPDVDAESSGSR